MKKEVDLEQIKQQVELVKQLLDDTKESREKRFKEKIRLRKKYGRYGID